MVQKFCLVCTPRSGSYYLLDHIARYFDLENGKEWFGRVKKVHYEGLRTSPVDIDHSVNEGLLTNKEMSLRLLYLKNYPTPFIIKCMPFQITKTILNEKGLNFGALFLLFNLKCLTHRTYRSKFFLFRF